MRKGEYIDISMPSESSSVPISTVYITPKLVHRPEGIRAATSRGLTRSARNLDDACVSLQRLVKFIVPLRQMEDHESRAHLLGRLACRAGSPDNYNREFAHGGISCPPNQESWQPSAAFP